MSTQEENLAAALALAAASVRIFPAGADKRPLLKDWQTVATCDANIINAWWERVRFLPANACGPNGLLVIDCDRHNGGADGVSAFKKLVDEHGPLPRDVPVVKTPNGGVHLYFRQPAGEPLGNGRGSLPPGVDVRGAGGFVIGPGAVLPDGRGWIAIPGRAPIGEAPPLAKWICEILRPPRHEEPRREGTGDTTDKRGRAYALAALRECECELAATPEGERNERLYKSAFRLATMAARGWLDAEEIIAALMRASTDNGYAREHGHRPTMTTIESGLQDGLKVPHPDLEDRDDGQHQSSDPGREKPKQKRQHETGSWDEPDMSLLDDTRGDLPNFPADTLGPIWIDWLLRSAHGAGVTTAHIVTPLLAAGSSLVGASRRIQPSRAWSEPLTLWGALIGFSGSGKTPGADVTLRALGVVEGLRSSDVAARQLAHESRSEAAKAAKKKWEKEVQEATEAGVPPPPKPAAAIDPGKFITPRLFCSDATIERLASLLQARPSGLFVYRDELAALFLNMSRYSGGSDKEFWLQAHDAKRHIVERQNAPAIVIKHLLLGLGGGFQPSKLQRSFNGEEDGMYARFLYAWPSAAEYRRLTDGVAEVEPELVNALSRLARLGEVDSEGDLVTRDVPLAAEAREAFEQFRQFVHQGLEALDGKEREYWSKGPMHVLRLAGTLCFMDWAWTGGPEPAVIEARYMQSAIRLWRDYFWHHGVAALRVMGISDKHRDARSVLRWIRANGRREVSVKDVRREALKQRLDADGTRG